MIELGVNNKNSQIQSSGPSLPYTFAEAETPEQRTQTLLKKQQEYGQKNYERISAAKGAGIISRAPQPSQTTASPGSQHDKYAWRSDTILPADPPTTDFQTPRQSYRSKCKARKNTLQDDIQFKEAEIEKKRRKWMTIWDSDDLEAEKRD